MKITKSLVVGLSMVLCWLIVASLFRSSVAQSFHTEAELREFQRWQHRMGGGEQPLFMHSEECAGCHGSDPMGLAMVNEEGEDINVYDDWRATMMANSAIDPFWRAKVSHEVTVNPSHQVELEDKCTSCHAPMGHYESLYSGAAHYSIAEMLGDSVALDGVSCVACHMISDENLGTQFSGALNYDTNRVIYGPYPDPFLGPMFEFVGYNPEFAEHILDAGLCAGCHTLITNTVDLEGNFTGGEFVEQATYHEWLNSSYNSENISCQNCHVPVINDEVVISANYSFLDPRSPFGLHYFVGGNFFMVNLMKDNAEAIGARAEPANFDSVAERTRRLLQEKTLELQLEKVDETADSLMYKVKLRNLAGHKFPSGYPARRAFIQFVVQTLPDGDTLFRSGMLDDDFEVIGQDPDFEAHYQTLNREDQVQIYELVLGDVNGDVTTVLERADHPIKDNRLTPFGFTQGHFAYDTTTIAGYALDDSDFNHEDGIEGSGTDEVYYHVAKEGYLGELSVSAKVYYQSAPPKWMQEMFSVSTPEIDTFKSMYYAADREPLVIQSEEIQDFSFFTGLEDEPTANVEYSLFPNPVSGGYVYLRRNNTTGAWPLLKWVDLMGKQFEVEFSANSDLLKLTLPPVHGMIFLNISDSGETQVIKVLNLK